ncbi:TPA: hypothetical protein ACJUMK_001403, partial [Streptococcus pneumoniae]
RSEYQKRKDKICPFSSLADFNPLQLTKSQKFIPIVFIDGFKNMKNMKKVRSQDMGAHFVILNLRYSEMK